MRYVAAYLLALLAGKEANADNIKTVLTAAGADIDEDAISRLTAALEGKDIDEIIAEGKKKLVNIGGGGGAAPAAAAGADAGAAAAEEEEEEEEEEESVEGAGGLFGGSDSDDSSD